MTDEIMLERRAARPRSERPARARGVRARAKDLEIILDVARRISGNESLDEVLQALVETTSLALNCDRCSFFLSDSSTGELYTRVAQGLRHHQTVRLQSSEGIAGAAFQTGRSIIVDDAYADPRFNPSIDAETSYVTKSVLCAPLRTVKGEIVGVAQALNKLEGVFTRDDQMILEGIAAQAVPALLSSQTVERMQKSRRQELAFLDIVADITSRDRPRQAVAAGDERGDPHAEGGALDALPARRQDQGTLLARRHGLENRRDPLSRHGRHRRRGVHLRPDASISRTPTPICASIRLRQADRLFHALDSVRPDRQQARVRSSA